jgi:hypothetical protein
MPIEASRPRSDQIGLRFPKSCKPSAPDYFSRRRRVVHRVLAYYGSSQSLADQENLFVSGEPGAVVVPG